MVPVRCPCGRGGRGTRDAQAQPLCSSVPLAEHGVPAQGPKPEISPDPTSDAGSQLPCVARSLKYSAMALPGVADSAEPRTDPFCSSAVLPPADPQHLQGRRYWQRCFCVYIHIFRMSPWAKALGQERACPGKEATVPGH